MADEKGDKTDARVVHNVTSNNQSGGITAHTVYQVPGRAQFTKELAEQLLKDLPVEKPVTLRIVGSDSDQMVGNAVAEFLSANGYALKVSRIGVLGPPPDRPFSLRFTENETILTVAASAR